MVLRDLVQPFCCLFHDIVFEFVKPLLHDVSTGLFDGMRGASRGINEVIVSLKDAVKEVWFYSSPRNVSRFLATAFILTIMPQVARTLHKIMETNIPARTGASNLAPAAPAARAVAPA